MKNSLKTVLLFLVVAILIGTCIYPQTKGLSLPLSEHTLYVGGDGPANYTNIQDAINIAASGDTVFVYNGTYKETLSIQKSIKLLGEEKTITIIDGEENDNVISIEGNSVKVSGFTVQNGSTGINIKNSTHVMIQQNIFQNLTCGLILNNCSTTNVSYNFIHDCYGHPAILSEESSYNTVYWNEVHNCGVGVTLDSSTNTIISHNHFHSNIYGVHCEGSSDSQIIDNTIESNHDEGIYAYYSTNNQITGNTIRWNANGMYLDYSNFNLIEKNNCSLNEYSGLLLATSSNNTIFENSLYSNYLCGIKIWSQSEQSNDNHIYHNNIQNNAMNAFDSFNNNWDNGYLYGGNYWSDYTGIDSNGNGIGDTPYTISGNTPPNQDLYPLMNPYIADHEPPTIKILSPEFAFIYVNGQKILPFYKTLIIGKITIATQAFDSITGIRKVEFSIDGILKYTDTEAPYSMVWSERYFTHKHTIKVTAYDQLGNTAKAELAVTKYF